jgi:hypothetical protein
MLDGIIAILRTAVRTLTFPYQMIHFKRSLKDYFYPCIFTSSNSEGGLVMNIIDPNKDTLGSLLGNQPKEILLKELLKKEKKKSGQVKIEPLQDKIPENK